MSLEADRDALILDALVDAPMGLVPLSEKTGIPWPLINLRLQVLLLRKLVRPITCLKEGFRMICWERL